MAWDERNDDALRKAWADGVSVAAIARMNRCSIGDVSVRVHELAVPEPGPSAAAAADASGGAGGGERRERGAGGSGGGGSNSVHSPLHRGGGTSVSVATNGDGTMSDMETAAAPAEAETEALGKARIIDGNIVISVPVAALARIVEEGPYGGEYRVTDPAVFASGLVDAINDEDEEGTTYVHRLFDDSVNDAIEAAAAGIEERPEEDETEATAKAAGDDAEALEPAAAAEPVADAASTEAAPAEAAA